MRPFQKLHILSITVTVWLCKTPRFSAMIITRTPFRISFFGGGSDYPGWFRENGGTVLATAIDKYCYLTCRYLPPFFAHHSRIVYTRIENVARNSEIEHPAVRGCLSLLKIEEGVEIHHDGDLPARTGLGTSSSFVVGLLNALHALQGRRRSKSDLAQEAIHIEQVVLGETVGVQDQTTAAYGGFNRIEFRPDGEVAVHPLVLPQVRLDELQQCLYLYFTGFARTASEIAQEQVRQMNHHRAELLEMMRMVEEAEAILTDLNHPLDDFGRMLDRGWRLKRSLSNRISTGEIDAIYEAARTAGALGGKLLGAGGGGFILFYVPFHRQQAFEKAMEQLLRVPFRFAPHGSHVLHYEPASQYDIDLAQARRRIYAAAGERHAASEAGK